MLLPRNKLYSLSNTCDEEEYVYANDLLNYDTSLLSMNVAEQQENTQAPQFRFCSFFR